MWHFEHIQTVCSVLQIPVLDEVEAPKRKNWQISFNLEITAGSCSDSQPAYCQTRLAAARHRAARRQGCHLNSDSSSSIEVLQSVLPTSKYPTNEVSGSHLTCAHGAKKTCCSNSQNRAACVAIFPRCLDSEAESAGRQDGVRYYTGGFP